MVAAVSALAPGATIGILGGGQLGRMLAMAAAQLGFKTIIYDPDSKAPAAQVASQHIVASYDDDKALDQLAQSCDVISFEFENIPAACVKRLNRQVDMFPDATALAISQDRLDEKNFINKLQIATAAFAYGDTPQELAQAAEKTGFPGILKTRRLGYDGKGQHRVANSGDILKLCHDISTQNFIYEGFVEFDCEISVIAARGRNGDITCYDVGENVHRNGILHTTTLPATIADALAQKAQNLTTKLLDALGYVGVIGVEFFVLKNSTLIINEFAPRVHNSGHWTEAGCVVSQFEQHIRAIAGWPLGTSSRHSDCVMENLIGSDVEHWQDLAARPDHMMHLYGKTETRPGRKMGHVTRISRR